MITKRMQELANMNEADNNKISEAGRLYAHLERVLGEIGTVARRNGGAELLAEHNVLPYLRNLTKMAEQVLERTVEEVEYKKRMEKV